ncbi:MAG TPA: glycoside hydrolase family 16 protein [Chthoniobacteraceae bacterium]|nr:glycoside hydrolase family 16 protein [Chthoniobacteraceae bacterium]
MKFPSGLFLCCVFLAFHIPRRADAQVAPEPTPFANVVQGYHYVWGDEFDGNALDLAKWQYRTDSKLWSTQLPANVSVAGGHLQIALKKEDAGGKHYTGGGIISRQRFEYGYYEASFRVPPGGGWHTSFWTMAYAGNGGTKPGNTQEIDICEQDSVKHTNFSAGIIAWGNSRRGIARKYTHTPNLGEGFHVWGCEFTPQSVKFYFDGQLTHQANAAQFKQGPQNIWLTCIAAAFGGTGRVDDSKLPAVAEFDYVRFYAK